MERLWLWTLGDVYHYDRMNSNCRWMSLIPTECIIEESLQEDDNSSVLNWPLVSAQAIDIKSTEDGRSYFSKVSTRELMSSFMKYNQVRVAPGNWNATNIVYLE